MEFKLCFDDYLFIVEVVHYVHQKPDYFADNSDDYFGYQEMDFKVIESFYYDEFSDRNIQIDNSAADRFLEEIEKELLIRINTIKEEELC